jgi:hypothetical protein
MNISEEIKSYMTGMGRHQIKRMAKEGLDKTGCKVLIGPGVITDKKGDLLMLGETVFDTPYKRALNFYYKSKSVKHKSLLFAELPAFDRDNYLISGGRNITSILRVSPSFKRFKK